MILAVLGVVVGLVVLAYAADQFVTGAARLAVALRVSQVMIGAVVIGFGTSAPELLASALAAGQGAVDLAVGNVIGSNVANITLVLGIAALVAPVSTTSGVLRREAPLSVATVLLLAVFVRGGLQLWHGLVLATALTLALAVVIAASRDGLPDAYADQVAGTLATRNPDTRRETLRTVIALAATVLAAKILIDSATFIADALGIAQGFIGLTVVAVGTSLPELATAVQAARRGQGDLIVGNLLGSNLFNAGAVGAVIAFIAPGGVSDPTLTGPAVALMAATALVALAFMITRATVVRWEGAVLLAAYLAVLPWLAVS